ncbi:MAG: DUF1501 domain-containing protein [Planctomycetes bacterium]|nr:DUF1501 domain-containing protein [Planctomycetota bacterium]
MSTSHRHAHELSRRAFFSQAGLSLGGIALGQLLGRDARAFDARAQRGPMHAPRAKAVIYLHMAGSPSQLDLFDPKPKLQELSGQPCPQSLLQGKRFAFLQGTPNLQGSPFRFARHGQSGAVLCEHLPHLASIADRLAFVKTVHTSEFNHAPAQLLMLTGNPRFGAATLGSWVSYGLGSLTQDLPTFVVLVSGGKTPDAGKSLWGSGFLPPQHQGVQCRTHGEPVLHVSDPAGLDRAGRAEILEAQRALSADEAARSGDPDAFARLESYELAFRMQTAVPEAFDLSREPEDVLELYGARPGHRSSTEGAPDPRVAARPDDAAFANSCLLARRLVERGVRFVQLFDWGWDHHGVSPGEDIPTNLPIKCRQIDRPITALILDLERRGLLDETLVVWGGEFGRTPMRQNNVPNAPWMGRDHQPEAFTMFFAGGGMKPGVTIGETDELGTHPVADPVHVRDLQATILHLLGFDPFRFRYPFQGLEQRWIGPEDHASIVRKLLA